jgi:hypothetical protein
MSFKMWKMRPDQIAWFDEHTKIDEIPESTVAWLRSMASSTHDLLKQFPPSCVVVAKTSMSVPAKKKLGVVLNVSLQNELKVAHADVDNNGWAGMCRPEDLQVIGYWKGLSPAKVAAILDSANG